MSDDITSAVTRIDWQCEVTGTLTTEAQSNAWSDAYRTGNPIEVGGRQCVVERMDFKRGGITNGVGMEFWATLREARP